jgi:hypothetical protein
MEVCRYLTRYLAFRTTSTLCRRRPLATSVSPLAFRKSFTSQSLDSGQPIDKSSELFEYTSERWMYVEPNYFKLKLMTDYSLKLQ